MVQSPFEKHLCIIVRGLMSKTHLIIAYAIDGNLSLMSKYSIAAVKNLLADETVVDRRDCC